MKTLHQNQIQAALQAVAEEYEISTKQIRSRTRIAPTPEARNLFWLVLRVATNKPAVQLAECVGRKHGSATLGLAHALSWLKLYPEMRMRYDRIAGRYLELTA